MGTNADSKTYPIVEISWVPSVKSKGTAATATARANENPDSCVEHTSQPATAPNIGIYTASGKLDEQSSLAQALREAKDMRDKKIRAAGAESSSLTNLENRSVEN